MRIGQYVYYVPSLDQPAIKGKIIKKEILGSRIYGLHIRTESGDIIKGYISQFTTDRPSVLDYWN